MSDLPRIFHRMFQRAAQPIEDPAQQENERGEGTVAMTIRITPPLRAFYERQAAAMGAASPSAVIAMVLEGVRHDTEESIGPNPARRLRDNAVGLRDRLFHLFEAHGFNAIMMADVLAEDGVTAADVKNEDAILARLNDRVVGRIATLFGVRREWLANENRKWVGGPNEQVCDWYKRPEAACLRIVELHKQGFSPHVIFLRRHAADFERAFGFEDSQWEDVGIIVRTERRTPGGRSYYNYERWFFDRWNNPRARESLKLITMWLARAGRSYEGIEVDAELLTRIARGDELPAVVVRDDNRKKGWDPSDYVPGPDWPAYHERDEVPSLKKEYALRDLDKYLEELGRKAPV